MSKYVYRPRINFMDMFPKIEEMKVGQVFHTIRFIDKANWYRDMANSRLEVDIYLTLNKQVMGRAEVIGISIITLKDIDDKIVKADTYPNWNVEKLYKLLEKFYGRKYEWEGMDTEFILIYLLPTEVLFTSNWVPQFKFE